MKAGDLDRRITIQRVTGTTINAAGTPVPTWGNVSTRRAQLAQRGTREFIRDGAVDEEVAIFRIRYLAGVTTADRVLFEGRVFNVKEVTEIGRRVGPELRTVGVRAEP